MVVPRRPPTIARPPVPKIGKPKVHLPQHPALPHAPEMAGLSGFGARRPRLTRSDVTAAVRRKGPLLVIVALAGLSYAWALGHDPLEPFYAASVRSMSSSWHDFFFGSFDPAGTVTLDKLPGAFWVQAFFVWVFGYHTWSMVLPQAIEGMVTVVFLYRAVHRLAGPVAGLVAAFVLAASPAAVALSRGNVSDALMVMLLVMAADAVSAGIAGDGQWHLVLAGLLVGLAFQAKMIEAWIVVPALALPYLLDGPSSLGVRVRRLLVGGTVAGIVSLLWMTVVSLIPASQRPYVDGSAHNSLFSQVFNYNGFGRFGDHTPLQLLAGQALGVGQVLGSPASGPGRLFSGSLGRATGWLLPAALVAAVWLLLSRRRRPRGDLLRAGVVLWATWLLILGVVFSVISTINPYYVGALSPAVAAVLGVAVAVLLEPHPAASSVASRPAWVPLRSPGGFAPDRRTVAVAVVVAFTVIYGCLLLPGTGHAVPGWLLPSAAAVGYVAVVVAAASAIRFFRVPFVAVVAVGLGACVLIPAGASAEMVVHQRGAFDVPFESQAQVQAVDDLFLSTPALVAKTVPRLRAVQRGAPWLLATQTSAVASVFITASGQEAFPIGGFTGTIPSPTLSELQHYIAQGRFHLALVGTSSDPRIQWIADHCTDLHRGTGTLHEYYCLPADG